MTPTEKELIHEIEQLILHAEEDSLDYSVLEHARKLVFRISHPKEYAEANAEAMNTEQLKTAKEFLREASGSIRADEYHLINVMNSFASQESKIAVEKDRESRWISVKDRLPEEGKEVLVWSDRYGRTFAALTGQNKHGSIWLYSGDPIVTFNAPSHWQPLPEPPKQLTP